MTIVYTCNVTGTGDQFRIGILEFWNCDERRRNTEEDFNFRGLFSFQGKSFKWRKDKVFGKSAVAIYSLILCATEVDLSIYVKSDPAAICRTRCYNRLLRYKRALDRVSEIENEIKQDFTHNGPFWVNRLMH